MTLSVALGICLGIMLGSLPYVILYKCDKESKIYFRDVIYKCKNNKNK